METLRPAEVLDQQAMLANKLMYPGHAMSDYHRYFMLDAQQKNDGRGAGMFYPLLGGNGKRTVTHELGAEFSRILGRMVAAGVSYQITTEMMDAMSAVAAETMGKISRLEAAELPGPTGFCWFDKPWMITDVNHEDIPVRAVSWEFLMIMSKGSEVDPFDGIREVGCVRIGLWSHMDDDIEMGRGNWDRMDREETIRDVGVLTIMHTACIPFGVGFGEDHAAGVDDILSMLHVLWMFLTMEIVAMHRPQLPRAFRRRALRSLVHGEVNVVTLRRAKHDPDMPHEQVKVDWSCRWVVQGHSRHLEEYEGAHHQAITVTLDHTCAVCGGRTTFIRPYIKGPSDRPFKVSRQLMRLSR